MEQGKVVRARHILAEGRHHAFGMPLYAKDRGGGVHKRLDDAVVGARGGLEAGRGLIDRLVMIAVDRGGRPHECGKRAGTADAVAAAAVRGDVLMQRAAEKDVDYLNAAADAEDGLAAAVKVLEERPLLLVAHRINRKRGALDALPETGGMDVAAAGEQQPVAAGGKAGGRAARIQYTRRAGAAQTGAVQLGLLS